MSPIQIITKMMNNEILLKETDKVFATGVFLQPVKCTINGIDQWRWVAVEFEDDTFYDGEIIDVYDYADSLDGLFIASS